MKQVLQQTRYALWALFNREKLRPTFRITNFNDLVIPKHTKLVILDKDNCFTKPHAPSVWPAFVDRWNSLVRGANDQEYSLVVVSNSAGDLTVDHDGSQAAALEETLTVPVLRHKLRKPLCYNELLNQFSHLDKREILVVGDRLLTDVLMANLMGVESVWIDPGLHPGWGNKLDNWVARWLL